MTEAQVKSLKHFSWKEKTMAGNPVAWEGYHYETMAWLDILRVYLRKPITLIRGGVEHGLDRNGEPKLTCVDAMTLAPFHSLFMGLMRLPGLSWGVYEGGSFHVDMREYDPLPARWFAFRDNEPREQSLFRKGYGGVISNKASGWIYMGWNQEKSFEALCYLAQLNKHRKTE